MDQSKQSSPNTANRRRHHRGQWHLGQQLAREQRHDDELVLDEQSHATHVTSTSQQRHFPSPPAPTAVPTARDRLEFFSKSPDVPPGEGRGELVKNLDEYSDLAKIKSWRSILSNFHMADFDWVGYTWPSIEHAYQGAKMLVHSRAAFVAFSKQGKAVDNGRNGTTVEQATFGEEGADKIEEMKENAAMMQRRADSAPGGATGGRSGGIGPAHGSHASRGPLRETEGYPHIGADTSLAARLARKLVPLTIEQVDFWDSVSQAIMLSISRAKYAQSPLARRTLLSTNEAELWHRVNVNDPLDRFDHLERIRAELLQETRNDD